MTDTLTNLLPTSSPPTTELVGQIATLREEAKSSGLGGRLEAVLERIEETARLIISEHAGMADELIGLYNQLGAVFDITRQLPNVRDEWQVATVFKHTIAAMFNRHEIALVCRDGSARRHYAAQSPGESGLVRCSWVSSLVDQAVNSARVVVDQCPTLGKDGVKFGKDDLRRTRKDDICTPSSSDHYGTTVVEALAAPVFCGGDLAFVMVVGRGAGVEEFRASDMSLAEVLATYCGDLIANFRLHHELRQVSVDLVRSLVCTVDQKDPYTSGHSIRVGYYATLLGREIGLDNEALQMLEWSALLHDIGKIGIRDDVLKKPGKLTAEEFEHIKEHPVRSFDVVRRVPQLRGALDGIRHHHEHYDGKGYPDGLVGDGIPLQARIIQVADVFDALTSSRSYRKAFDWGKALRILEEESGTTVDPHLAGTFDGLIRQRCEGDPGAWQDLTRDAESTLYGETAETGRVHPDAPTKKR